ncbi:hypothetical protein VCSRO121_3472 [Vibrio cholerae]|nr:hypothetical protein VCSRO121_3472 [Vibrio cholerae]
MKASKYKQLADQYGFTLEQVKKIGSVFNSIRWRCGRLKGYETVVCEWQDLEEYIKFLVEEATAGRDFHKFKRFATCRIDDTGNYSTTNCFISSCSDNVKTAQAQPIQVYQSTDKTRPIYFKYGVKAFYNKNKDVLRVSLSKLYRMVKQNKWIDIYHSGEFVGQVKIVVL